MKFSVWFKQWVSAFFKLLTVNSRRRKSKEQRERERAARIRARRGANYYLPKKTRKKRRKNGAAQNERLVSALFGFLAVSLGIVFLPLGLFDWGRKSVSARRKANGGTKHGHKQAVSRKADKTAGLRKDVKGSPKNKDVGKRNSCNHTRSSDQSSTVYHLEDTSLPYSRRSDCTSENAQTCEIAPKSGPTNESDVYIRKRMTAVGLYDSDATALSGVQIGSLIDFAAETDNPCDSRAIKLVCNGNKIGYVAKEDQAAIFTCVKLGFPVYGIVTDIHFEDGYIKYEYEAWFGAE